MKNYKSISEPRVRESPRDLCVHTQPRLLSNVAGSHRLELVAFFLILRSESCDEKTLVVLKAKLCRRKYYGYVVTQIFIWG